MELIFLGRGAAFNPKEGNTSAYFIENNNLFLIDCGESIFERLIEKELLSNVTINLMITHTHSDHIGSIGSLVMYSFYEMKKRVNIIIPKKAKHLSNIKNILSDFGCTDEMYNFILEENYDYNYESFQKIRYVETSHAKNLNCYSLLFNTDKGIVYYSGDTNESNTIEKLINDNNPIYRLYVDTTSNDFKDNPHLYIGILNETIPDSLKDKVYCMHLNNLECEALAKELGFNVVNK